jgi:acetolactate decarboxylase
MFLVLVIALMAGCANVKEKTIMYQYSSLNAFNSGVYSGDLSIQELKKHGNFGIGTFNGIDGELILLCGVTYQAKEDGRIIKVKKGIEIPFAEVNYFKPSINASLEKPLSLKELAEYIDLLIPDKNLIFAVKVEGEFSSVDTRSFEKQKEPYTPFEEVVKSEHVNKFNGIKGTLVGYYFPDYMKEIGYGGYHFHFLSRDKKRGGHVLDCNITNGQIRINQVDGMNMEFNEVKNLKIK